MKQLKIYRLLNIFAITFLFFVKFAKSEAEWAVTEDGTKYLIQSKYEYTWLEALHECSKRNLSLVTIDSAEKNVQLVNLLKNRFGIGLDLWIGATASTAENSQRKFVWTANGKTFNFANWETGEPNNLGGDQPCVHMWSKSNNFTWADGQWHLKYGYICEATFVTNYRQIMDEKRQAIKQIMDKLNLYFKKKLRLNDRVNEDQAAVLQEINAELEDKLERTKLIIDHILDNENVKV